MGRRRHAAALGLLATGAVPAVIAVASASWAAPPEDTFVLVATPTEVEPGGELALEGTCYSEVLGTAQEVFVRLARRVPPGSGLEPYSVFVDLPVDQSASTFSGVLGVPLDAPAGDHRIGGFCRWDDQAIEVNDTAIVVLGDATPPTTSTSTPATTTTTVPGPPSTAPPATPVAGEARLAG